MNPAFDGFGPQALSFFSALAFHQNRHWMEANKALYETDVRRPMGLLLDDLSAELARRDVPLRGALKTAMFRLNRDIRFAKDKSLYKLAAGAVLTRSGGKNEPGLLYLHIDPLGSFIACGVYRPLPVQLTEIRHDIVARAAAFRAACAAMDGLVLSGDDKLTRAPRGFEAVAEADLADGLRLRSLVFRRLLQEGDVFSPKLVATIADFAEQSAPFLRFCWNALDRVPVEMTRGIVDQGWNRSKKPCPDREPSGSHAAGHNFRPFCAIATRAGEPEGSRSKAAAILFPSGAIML